MNKRLPLGLLAILLIVLLAGIGVAYGLWSETLTIDGTVNTGEVNIGFVDPPTIAEYINGKPEEKWPQEKWDVANCEASVSTDRNTLTILAKYAYPSWTCQVTFEVESLGTVPVHVFKPYKVRGPLWRDLQILSCEKISATTKEASEAFDGMEACTSTDETKCGEYWQLHQGDKLQCTLNIHFTNNDNVMQGREYKFVYKVFGKQFNE